MKLATLLGLTSLCLIAACGQKGGNATASAGGTSSGGGAPAAATSGADTTLTMADLPHPKAGLWETTITDTDLPKPSTDTNCLSGQAPSMTKMPEGCADLSIKRTFTGQIVIDANCKTPQFTMVAHSVSTGDFQTHMSTDSESTMTMQGQPPRMSKMHIDAHWVGPCAPGQKPDDLPDTPDKGTN
jgi:hypothetical protein